MTDRKLERYREEMKHEPPSPGEHPLADQWDYRGSKEEREALADELAARGEQPDQEESLF